jgi:hypothetical protein
MTARITFENTRAPVTLRSRGSFMSRIAGGMAGRDTYHV